ncbi:Unsaturated rhamnogalacturonyl hydrolase YteR [Pontiella sulfatireligans]|uniref:Unsaturated rhamnogalacturonyl hydrolase YteR n=2 Tax=Pontiella sulfatireligans TaxID=2750658 RepID=A0A6C2URU8_9BACT|nr:Unsaturated rhamnogalacturonyl hydrolase YteR [Pontiella sulfatireligans]
MNWIDMKRIYWSSLILLNALSFAGSAGGHSDVAALQDFPVDKVPERIGTRAVQRFLGSPHSKYGVLPPHKEVKQISYPDVCTWVGGLWFAEASGDAELLKGLEQRFQPLFDDEKWLLPSCDGVNHNVFGALALELYLQTGDQKYYDLGMAYADSQWEVPADATPEQKAWAAKGYSWQTRLWIDDTFLINAVQSQAYRATGDRKYIDRAARQMVIYLDELQRDNGLFHHAPFAPFYWGRGNGWMAVGLSDLLRFLPADNPDRDRIMAGYQEMMATLLSYQADDGMWRQLIDQPDFWKETSGTAMFTYAMITGVKEGWLDAAVYGPAARKGWLALTDYVNEDSNLTEICRGMDARDFIEGYRKPIRRVGDLHGQAPLIWCATALLRDSDSDGHPKTDCSLYFKTNDAVQEEEVFSESGDLFLDLGHHGPAIENEWMALRFYFDHKAAIDVYSKARPGLELAETKWYPTEEQQLSGWGADYYKVGPTLGLGGIRLWDGEKMVRLNPVSSRSARVGKTADSAWMEMCSMGVPYQGRTVDVTVRVTVRSGSRFAEVEASVAGESVQFVSGINYHPGSTVRSGRGWISTWGVHPEDVAAEQVAVGGAILFDENDVEKRVDDGKQILLISKPSSTLRCRVTSSCAKDPELGSIERLAALCVKSVPVNERRISIEEYRDKMAGGWIGQMVGVGWGAPTEFKFCGEIIPEEKVPVWEPEMVNQYNQDDIYVEMTFLRSMEVHGFNVSMRQAGIDFANSGYKLWHANLYGRKNLRKGIAPPDSGHPQFNGHADDIDYQIEADFSGLIAPGMPNVGIELGEKFGRLVNYGDGLYGGQFVAGMYAAAFFEDDPKALVEAGLACVPDGSQFAEAIRDVIEWHAEHPDDWQVVWKKIDEKYQRNADYRRFSCKNEIPAFNIDAKINAAYIVMGMLYGEGDLEKTIVISMRCGADSDCNPSSAAGVLGTAMGMKNLPVRYTSALDRTPKFSHTDYSFDSLLTVCETLARQAVVQQGGRIDGDFFVIPVRDPQPSALEQCWEPGPIADSRYTAEEMAMINPPKAGDGAGALELNISKDLSTFAPGWAARDCGEAMRPGLKAEWKGRTNVLLTHPLSTDSPCVIFRSLDVPAGKKTTVELSVLNDHRGDFNLVVQADGKEIFHKEIAEGTWQDLSVDLSEYAGKSIELEVLNQASGWKFEAAYWSRIAIQSKDKGE